MKYKSSSGNEERMMIMDCYNSSELECEDSKLIKDNLMRTKFSPTYAIGD